jgi:putative endonuclease
MSRKYYVYILRCSDESYYTGITNDLERRLAEHQAGVHEYAYTRSRRPVTLVFSETFDHPTKAIIFEKQVKGWRREKKEALINGRYDLLPELANTRKR